MSREFFLYRFSSQLMNCPDLVVYFQSPCISYNQKLYGAAYMSGQGSAVHLVKFYKDPAGDVYFDDAELRDEGRPTAMYVFSVFSDGFDPVDVFEKIEGALIKGGKKGAKTVEQKLNAWFLG